MCVGKAMIIRKGQRYPDYVMDSNDHKPLVIKLKLTDERPAMLRNFIRVELSPLNSLTSTKPADWDVYIDECGDLPAWFEDKKADWEYKCTKIMTEKIVPSWIKDGINGSLNLQDTEIRTLGSLKSVGGYLNLRGTQVRTLGSLRSVNGSLDLWGTQVKTLGSLRSVGCFLYLQGTQIRTLGSLESIGGSLDLQNTQVKTLGSLKNVGGYLYLRGTQVRTLGSLRSVGGYLDLRGTQIGMLPKNLKAGGAIYKDF